MTIASAMDYKLTGFPFIYLRIPLADRRLPRRAYLDLLNKLNKRLAGWAACFLSIAGRLVLLNSILSSLPVYYMSVLNMPQWVLDHIDKIRRPFLWHGAGDQTKGYNLAKWELFCQPKLAKGLGVLDLRAFNKALLLKWYWWWFKPDDKMWKSLFCNTASIAHMVPNSGVFLTLKGEMASFFIVSTQWTPGDGNSISLWNQN